jgi:hydroxymethylpyrimidine/phosphomethylpyrimidine kinase
MVRPRIVLTISASDPTATDGVQADLKTFSSLGVHGAAVITALTGGGAPAIALEPELIQQQLNTALTAMKPDIVMTGTLPDATTVQAVADTLRRHEVARLVVDPVLVGAGGVRLADDATVEALLAQLMPLALVVTPNVTEAAMLSGLPVGTWDEVRLAAEQIASRGASNVVIKGGRREGPVVTDLLFDGSDFREYSTERVPVDGVSGSGSAFAAAMAASMAKGETIEHSVAAAKAFVAKSLQNVYELADGRPALHHFYRYWQVRPPQHDPSDR